MSLLERIASGWGNAVGAYRKAIVGQLSGVSRPSMLSDFAAGERWKGGDLGERDAAQRRAYQNSWFFAGSRLKAQEVGAAELEIVMETPDGRELVIAGHPFLRLLKRPNPVMGRAFLWQYTQEWLDLDGSAYWLILPTGQGQPGEIWPLPSNQVTPYPGDKDRIMDYYEFQTGSTIVRINAEYVCHLRIPNPFDIFRGLSTLAPAMLPVDSDNAMSYWNGALFGENNVMPSVIINLSSGEAGGSIEDSDLQAVKDQLQAEYQAWMRKTVITSAFKMEVNPVGWSQKDADFLNGRQFSKEEILIDLGVPPGLMDKNATEANATVAKAQFKEFLWGELVLLSEQLTAQVIIPFYGKQFSSRFKDIRLANRQLELQEDAAAQQVLTIDERRERFWGKPPLPDGRGKLTVLELQAAPAEISTQPAQADTAQLDGLPSGNALENQAKGDLRRWRERSIKSVELGRDLAYPFTSDVIPADLRESVQEGLELAQTQDDVKEIFGAAQKGIIRSWRPWSAFEQRLADIVAEFLSGQAQHLIDDIQAKGPGATGDPELWRQQADDLRAAVQPLLLELTRTAVNRVKLSLGNSGVSVDWNLANSQAELWARDHAAQLVRQVTTTTKQQIADQVAAWTQSSEGLPGLVDRIAGLVDDDAQPLFNRTRAERIAVTEATNTYGGANATAWAAAGYAPAAFKPAGHVGCRCYLQSFTAPDGQKVLKWYSARDERVCKRPIKTPWGMVQGCAALHGVIVSEGIWMGKKVENAT